MIQSCQLRQQKTASYRNHFYPHASLSTSLLKPHPSLTRGDCLLARVVSEKVVIEILGHHWGMTLSGMGLCLDYRRRRLCLLKREVTDSAKKMVRNSTGSICNHVTGRQKKNENTNPLEQSFAGAAHRTLV